MFLRRLSWLSVCSSSPPVTRSTIPNRLNYRPAGNSRSPSGSRPASSQRLRRTVASVWEPGSWAVTGWLALGLRAPWMTSDPATTLYVDDAHAARLRLEPEDSPASGYVRWQAELAFASSPPDDGCSTTRPCRKDLSRTFASTGTCGATAFAVPTLLNIFGPRGSASDEPNTTRTRGCVVHGRVLQQ